MSADLLSELWPAEAGLYGEFRLFRGEKREQLFMPLANGPIHEALGHISALDLMGWDCYYGVLPRKARGGTAADTDCVVRALWADIDAKKVGGKDAALHATLRMTTFPPSAVVDSGHGYHAYWFLSRVEPYSLVVPYLKGIAREVGGDHVHDQARILRVPGTHNHKDAPAPPVRLLTFDTTRRYDLTDLPHVEDRPTVRVSNRTYEPREMPGWLLNLLDEAQPKGARSEAVFRAVIWMLRYGASDHDIQLAIFSHPNGIGEKYYEMSVPNADRWLARTIEAARASL
jgi:hypothetical protein